MTYRIMGLDQYRKSKASSICIGTFDGFHKGHQKLAKNAEFMLTFNPHPKNIISPDARIERLTLPNELAYFFRNILLIEFTPLIATLSPSEFLTHFIEPLSPKKITIGYDFKFGKHGLGNIDTLTDWGRSNDCQVIEVPIQSHSTTTPYKSSIIRKELNKNPEHAIELLGHPYLISGTVISGEKRGRSIGFPTANMSPPSNKCLPKFGVYKSTVIHNKTHYEAITYIGKKPTFKNDKAQVETHILNDFSDDLYGETIMVLIHQFIRDDLQFKSIDALKQQIQLDITNSTQ